MPRVIFVQAPFQKGLYAMENPAQCHIQQTCITRQLEAITVVSQKLLFDIWLIWGCDQNLHS